TRRAGSPSRLPPRAPSPAAPPPPSLHDALPIFHREDPLAERPHDPPAADVRPGPDREARRDDHPGRDVEVVDLVRLEESEGDHRSEEHTSELQSRFDLVCRLLLEKKNPART